MDALPARQACLPLTLIRDRPQKAALFQVKYVFNDHFRPHPMQRAIAPAGEPERFSRGGGLSSGCEAFPVA